MFGFNLLNDRVGRLEATVRRQQLVIAELCRRLDIDPPTVDPTQSLDDTERDLVAQGKKIAAIKHHRERTGSGLREAKDVVERG